MRKLTYEEVKEFIEAQGYKLISEEYINNSTHIFIKCNKGHIYPVKFSNFKEGTRCPECAKNKTYTYEYVKKFIEIDSKSGCKLLSSEYKNNHTKLEIQCNCGKVFDVIFSSFIYGKRKCDGCNNYIKEYTNEEIKKIVNNKLGKDWEIIKIYKNNKYKVLDLKDHFGFLYSGIFLGNIQKNRVPLKFSKYNSNTLHNIKLWCKLEEKPFELISEKYTNKDLELEWMCKKCRKPFYRNWHTVYSHKYGCILCGDGISYPEKFTHSFLRQLNIKYMYQYSPKWISPKRYDFYFELKNNNYIIETDGGLGHGEENALSGQTATETSAIDDYKDFMAEKNNIKLLRIDCKKSNLEYIKNNILNSELSKLFNLSNMDWIKCHEFACSSLIKEVCDLWNNGIKNTQDISNIVYLNRVTVIKYLKNGKILNMCDYDSKLEMRKNGSINGKKRRKVVYQYTLDGKFIKEYKSLLEAEVTTGLKGIHQCCAGKNKRAGSFIWKYKVDVDNKNDIDVYKKDFTHLQKRVVQFKNESVYVWDSSTIAGTELKLIPSNIIRCCKGKVKTCGGFKWVYYEDYIAQQENNKNEADVINT